MSSSLILLVAWSLDLLYGEYPNRWHPVVWMGTLIGRLQAFFLGCGRNGEKLGSWILLIGVAGGFATLVALLIQALSAWPWLQGLVAIYWLKASFALRALAEAAEQVYRSLRQGSIDRAQNELMALCSRDASKLDPALLTEASISSLAENLSDSVIAPLFYFVLFGVSGAVFYRAVNTLDAMVGYKNHLRHLGFASARCDDLLNWIPARITACLLLMAGVCLRGFPVRHAWKIALRDHALTPSPNGGWPMATMAGLLSIRLRKPEVYTLGDALLPTRTEHFVPALHLTRLAGWMGFVLTIIALLSLGGQR